MSKKLVIIGFVAGGVVLAGSVAYVFLDDAGAGRKGGAVEKTGSRRKGAGGDRFGDAAFEGDAGVGAGAAALTPEQAAKVRSALERLGNDTAVRNALTAGVAEPWPVAMAQKQLERCVEVVQRGLAPESTVVPADVCACATRAFQQVYPGNPPRPKDGNARRIVRENFDTALDECMNP